MRASSEAILSEVILEVIEDADNVRVVLAGDPEDWLVCFEKTTDFPARAWAERMVGLYNAGVPRSCTLVEPVDLTFAII
jgi:hypothetical protein